MQLFRSQLSRFSPHPHRDSWMRNHLKQWLRLLQWSSFFTLISAGWLTYQHHSPLGNSFKLDEKIAGWLNITEPSIIRYIMIAIATLLWIGALCTFRCGNYYKRKYVIPVFIAVTLLAITLILYTIESQMPSVTLATFIMPVSFPFLLLRYQVWKNQVDHWSLFACLIIAITIGGYSYQSLHNPAGIHTPAGIPIRMSELSPELNSLILISVAYIALGTAIALFITSLRRLALYLSILLAFTITGATFISYFSFTESFYNISQWLPMTLMVISYWLLPTLILLTLASQRKTKTLKL